MKMLLDSSYLLPFIQIQVERLSPRFILDLLNDPTKSDWEFYYCDISLFELAAKGMKLLSTSLNSNNSKLTLEDIQHGLDVIRWNPHFHQILWFDHPFILGLISELRKIHSDFIDCTIFAAAICNTDAIATFDETFYNKIRKNAILCQKIKKINENFQFYFYDFSKNPKIIL